MTTKTKGTSTHEKSLSKPLPKHPNVTSRCRFIDPRRRTVIPAAALDEAGISACSVMEWKAVNGCVVGSPIVGTTTINVATGRTVKKGR